MSRGHRRGLTLSCALALLALCLAAPAARSDEGEAKEAPKEQPKEEPKEQPKEEPKEQPKELGSLEVHTHVPTFVALIRPGDIQKSDENGWWDVWKRLKKAKDYKASPATFDELSPGTYILVVHNPAATDADKDKSDGLVLEKLQITSGKKVLRYQAKHFKEWNCLSCPWLYVSDGKGGHVRLHEILSDVVGRSAARTLRYSLPASVRQGDVVRLQIREEKDEITYLDALSLNVGGVSVAALVDGVLSSALASADGRPIVLRKGDRLNIEFVLPAGTPVDAGLELVAHGYYDPDRAMLEALLQSFTPAR